jgi:Ca2+-binding RTX toxin-like protein
MGYAMSRTRKQVSAGVRGLRPKRGLSALTAATLASAVLTPVVMGPVPASAAPVGAGFELHRSDLAFILKQIKIAETHVASRTAEGRYPCSSMLDPTGTDPNKIPTNGTNGEVLPWGLRTVLGTCNNLLPGQENYGAADQPFPHRTERQFQPKYSAPGMVTDSEPRVISNLIVDQTSANPAAVAASGTPTTDANGNPVPLPPRSQTLPIGNVAPDVGLSAPFNSVFTLFGQFFDHGLDLVAKQGPPIMIPLRADDPLVTHGPDGTQQTGDEVSPGTPMFVTRAVPDLSRQPVNLTTPFVDQNQTYTSHPSHQVFLRQYDATTAVPVITGKLIEDEGDPLVEGDEGMATWAQVKEQSRAVLGIALSDTDVLNVPEVLTDPYGHFIPGPTGLPQLVTDAGPVEGNLIDPVSPLQVGARRTGHAFLDDIAHHAVPVGRLGSLSPDSDTAVNEPFDPREPGTYDNEMLDAHFIAGDGRVNENIGLTAVHHVFHSEHNRLTDEIDALIDSQGESFRAQWHAVNPESGWSYGERLFQAARFVTEMEYQHLAFEEFARKVQPMVNAFGEGGTGYETVTNAAIAGEFAHAVYRFGHSMLTETVERRTPSGAPRDLPLLEAFLNPPKFQEGGLTAQRAAGDIFRGMSHQIGSEIDEFVTEALRNNLLGLPLDLAAINLARARDTGVPSLNQARRAFYADSNNTQVMPYTSWMDFGFNLKHRESLVNFVAAYGQHPTVRDSGPDGVLVDDTATPQDESADNVTTMAAKRAAANELLKPSPVEPVVEEGASGPTPEAEAAAAQATEAKEADARDFMYSTGAWENTETGINLVELWVGGLAEKQMVGGGLLGPTFNYVFEKQMEDLQFGDRFYYLARTQGLNLLVQLEGNSLAELVMRNTDVGGLPADIFSRPDLVFNLPNMGPVGGPIVDDPTTQDVDEANQPDLTWMPSAQGPTIRFSGPEHVVFNGRDDAGDRIHSSEGDDTVRGNGGNDWMQGGDGADNLIGGAGDDIMSDLNGDDVLKGGPGNDALSSGQGFGGDLNQGGPGKDFIIGGNDVTETFAGPGDDFIFAGDDLDTVFGDEGNDWIEGGFGPFNLLQGDNGQAFQDDPNGGHDVIDGDGGEQDYDAEGGDDIMLAGPGIQRAEGMLGFDWVTHKGDPTKANSDMAISTLLPPSLQDLRDRFDLVEALSGWDKDDVLRGDNRTAAELTGGDVNRPDQNHNLTDEGAARVRGLEALVPADNAASDIRFNAGNIILGGGGSDTIEGRGGDDIIDGDKWLDVQLTADVNGDGVIGADERFNSVKQLQNLVFAGKLNPGVIEIDRFIADPVETAPGEDVVVFSGPAEDYSVTEGTPGVFTVAHDGGAGVDGTDTVRNVELIRFGAAAPVAISSVVTTPAEPEPATLTVSSDAPEVGVELTVTLAGNGDGTTGHSWQVQDVTDGPWVEVDNGVTFTPTEDLVGKGLRVVVTFTNSAGQPDELTHLFSAPIAGASGTGGGTTPPPTGGTDGGTTPPPTGGTDGGTTPPPTGGTDGGTTPPPTGGTDGGTTPPPTGGTDPGTDPGTGTATVATAPGIRFVMAGAAGGRSTARVAWKAPVANGGSPITRYKVVALRLHRDGSIASRTVKFVSASSRAQTMVLRPGRYRFQVRAVNAVGMSEARTSRVVRAR